MTPEELVERVNRHLTPELHLLRAWQVPLTAPSLTPSVREALYQVSLPVNGSGAEMKARLGSPELCHEWLGRPSIPVSVQRKEKVMEIDARPLIIELGTLPQEGGALRWGLRLKTGQGAGVRPQAIMACLLKDALNGQFDGWETRLRVARTTLVLDGDR